MTVLQHLAKELEALVILLQKTHCITSESFNLEFLNIIVLWQDDKTHIIFGHQILLKIYLLYCLITAETRFFSSLFIIFQYKRLYNDCVNANFAIQII